MASPLGVLSSLAHAINKNDEKTKKNCKKKTLKGQGENRKAASSLHTCRGLPAFSWRFLVALD